MAYIQSVVGDLRAGVKVFRVFAWNYTTKLYVTGLLNRLRLNLSLVLYLRIFGSPNCVWLLYVFTSGTYV